MLRTSFTVFTPVYNRVDLLARTYASLLRQTFRDFEWLVVDDGSAERIGPSLAKWQAEAPFPIRHIAQPHQGKHRAHNTALAHARGDLFAVLDADDELLPHALERLLFHWQSIPAANRRRYSGVTGLCLDPRGHVVGRPFPSDVFDCRHDEAVAKYRVTGEKWGCHRVDVLRQFPFPEAPGEEYCPEGVVWNRIARAGYAVRHVNDPLRIYYPGGSVSGSVRTVLMQSPVLARLFYCELLQTRGRAWLTYKNTINYVRYSFHGGVAVPRVIRDAPAPGVALACLPAGYALCAIDRVQQTAARNGRPA